MMIALNVFKVRTRPRASSNFYSMFYEWSMTQCFSLKSRQASHRAVIRASRISKPSIGRFLHTTSSLKDGPTKASPEPLLSTHLRSLMRTIPHSVVVITSTTSSTYSSNPISTFKGMTISSFTTLTLTPSPIVTFNIKKPSGTLEAIRASKEFLVHILSANIKGAQVADAFTRGNSPELWEADGGNGFRVVQAKAGEPPLLLGEGIKTVLRCRLHEGVGDGGCVEVGDHSLILGDVVGIIEPPPVKETEQQSGLCYLDGKYRRFGDVIEIGEGEDCKIGG